MYVLVYRGDGSLMRLPPNIYAQLELRDPTVAATLRSWIEAETDVHVSGCGVSPAPCCVTVTAVDQTRGVGLPRVLGHVITWTFAVIDGHHVVTDIAVVARYHRRRSRSGTSHADRYLATTATQDRA